MTCNACTTAESNPLSGLYFAGCADCGARAIARSQEYAISVAAREFSAVYRLALSRILRADEALDQAHKRVRAWDRKITAARIAAAQPQGATT
jgi:hypothetical protein